MPAPRVVLFGLFAVAIGCGDMTSDGVDSSLTTESSLAPTGGIPASGWFVLPSTPVIAAVERGTVSDPGPVVLSIFHKEGSPDDDGEAVRAGFAIGDATGVPAEEFETDGNVVVVDGREFRWTEEGEGQRAYVGPTHNGGTVVLATLNLTEDDIEAMLSQATVSDGGVSFDGQPVPSGFLDGGTSTSQLNFFRGATGGMAPTGGFRARFGAPHPTSESPWEHVPGDGAVTLSAWPVASSDPLNAARYNLDGERETTITLSDGTVATAFTSQPGDEFIEYVVWPQGSTWLSLARASTGQLDELVEQAGTVRSATPDEAEALDALADG
ncbi:MAG: hypothetical protein AAGG08_10055 [Actinomycetota bacterium]